MTSAKALPERPEVKRLFDDRFLPPPAERVRHLAQA